MNSHERKIHADPDPSAPVTGWPINPSGVADEAGQAVVRVAAPSDLRSIVALERSIPEAAHWPAQEYAAMLAPRENSPVTRHLLVAEAGGELLGYVVGKLLRTGTRALGEPENPGEPENLGELENIAVAQASRRRGIGRQLLRAVVDWCASRGAVQVELEVRASNHAAIAMYGRSRWQHTGRRPDYYHDPVEDAVLMTLALRPPQSAESGTRSGKPL